MKQNRDKTKVVRDYFILNILILFIEIFIRVMGRAVYSTTQPVTTAKRTLYMEMTH